MNAAPELPFAVIGRSVSRYSQTPKALERWEVVEVGRETPTRLYRHAQKPNRYGHDLYWDRASAVGRFATREEAEAFLASAKAALAEPVTARDAASRAYQDARERSSAAQRALNDAIEAWLASATA
jgi:hypothetical protein